MREFMMVRTSRRRSKSWLAKSAVSASSSAALTGGLEARKSSSGSTMPRPNSSRQTRLAWARAKNGLSGAATQSASACKRSASGANAGVSAPGKSGLKVSLVRG